MSRSISIVRYIAISGTLGTLLTLFAQVSSANNGAPVGQGNPQDNLPKVGTTTPTPVIFNIQTPAPNPALENLLNSHLIVSGFKINGVKTLPYEQVFAQFSGFVNRDTTVAELITAANRVTQMYHDRGYPLSFAFVPAQNFENKEVTITVVEGYVKSVKVTGDHTNDSKYLQRVAAQLEKERPLSQKTFEHVAAILSMQPGIKITANAPPPTTVDGGTEMILDVKRHPVSVGVGIQSLQSGIRGLVTASSNGLTPLGERVTVGTLQPSGDWHEKYYLLNYVQPIGINGMLLKLDASNYTARPKNDTLISLQYEPTYRTKSSHVGANLSYPLILDSTHNLTITGGVYGASDAQTFTRTILIPPTTTKLNTNTRVASAEISYLTSTKGIYNLQQTRQIIFGLYHGVSGLGSSKENTDADLDFTRENLQLAFSQQLPKGFGATFSAKGQYSANTLPSSEAISFGGQLFGAGYPVGDIAGDKGWGISAELNHLYPTSYSYVKNLQPYLLIDHAQVFLNSGKVIDNNLASVALGTRLTDSKHYSFDVSVAKPIGDKPINTDSRSPRINFSYTWTSD
jgi:hemolysin activation/secretion protein